jgi:aminoglycoside N3'-acetyltransferase
MEAVSLVPLKPKPYDGPVLEDQPLRVIKNDDKDSSVILLGADDFGDTKLHMIGKFGSDGKLSFASAAGVPGTTWLLPRDVWITVGDLRVRGFKIRVSKTTYDWKNVHTGKMESVPDVIRVEIENLDDKAPGELVFQVEKNKQVRFLLSQKVGVFVFSDLSDSKERLVDQIGWKKMQ